MAAYNGVNGATMTESPLLRDVLQGRVGLRRRRDVRLVRRPLHRGGGQRRARPGDARAGRPVGRRAGRRPCARARSTRRRSTTRSLRILRLAARVGALDGTAPAARRPACDDADGRRASCARAAAAGSCSRATTAVLPLDRRGAAPRRRRSGRTPPSARTLGGGSATVFPPYTVSPLDGLRAALGADVRGRRTRRACAPTRDPAAAPVAAQPDGRPGARCASSTPTARARRRAAAAAARSTGWARSAPCRRPTSRASRSTRAARRRRRRARDRRLGHRPLPARRSAARRSSTSELALPPGADLVEAHDEPAAARRHRSTLEAGRGGRGRARHDSQPAERRPDSGAMFQLNVEPPHGPDDEELERAVALAREADVAVVVVGTTEEVESEGFDRDSLALPGPPGRARPPRRRGQPAHRRGRQRRRARAAAVGRRGRGGAARLVPRAGVRQRARRRPARRRRARRPAAHHVAASEDGLPSTQPVDGVLAYDEGLFIGYRAYDRDGRAPLLPVRPRPRLHDLGVRLEAATDRAGRTRVRVRVRNTGARRGREVVQLYAGGPAASRAAARWLVRSPWSTPARGRRPWRS